LDMVIFALVKTADFVSLPIFTHSLLKMEVKLPKMAFMYNLI